MESIARVCQSVGFNTIPAWLRPYSVLSNGERFRAEIARRLLSPSDYIIIDEFTSVVDRQVAQITSDAVQRYIRSTNSKDVSPRPLRLVAASCHYDIIDWLQPDWILEPGNPCRFSWRSLRQRPSITVSVSRVKYETWRLFKDFHYMSQDLNKAARCYGIYVKSASGVDSGFFGGEIPSYGDGCGDNFRAGAGLRLASDERTDLDVENSELVQRTRGSENDESRTQLGPEEDGRSSPTDEGSTSEDDAAANEPNDSGHVQVRLQRSEHIRETKTSRIASMCGVLYRPHPRVNDIVGFTRMVTLPDFQGLGLAFVLANTVAAAYKALGKRLHSYPNHPAWIRSYQRSPLWMQVKQSGNFSPRAGKSSSVGGFGGRRCAVFMYIGPAGDVEESKKLIHPEET